MLPDPAVGSRTGRHRRFGVHPRGVRRFFCTYGCPVSFVALWIKVLAVTSYLERQVTWEIAGRFFASNVVGHPANLLCLHLEPTPPSPHKLLVLCRGPSLRPSRRTHSRAMCSCLTAFGTSYRPVTHRNHSSPVVTRLVRPIL